MTPEEIAAIRRSFTQQGYPDVSPVQAATTRIVNRLCGALEVEQRYRAEDIEDLDSERAAHAETKRVLREMLAGLRHRAVTQFNHVDDPGWYQLFKALAAAEQAVKE